MVISPLFGGKPTLIASLFAGELTLPSLLHTDQYDNAERVTEKGFGSKINVFTCSEAEFRDTIEAVLRDQEMRERVEAAARRIKTSNQGPRAAAEAIVNVADC